MSLLQIDASPSIRFAYSMSFAQQLGRTSMSIQEKLLQDITEKLRADCQARAAQGYCSCDVSFSKPDYFHAQSWDTLRQRLKQLGFEDSAVSSTQHKGHQQVRLCAKWKLEPEEPEETVKEPQGTSSTCPVCLETRPVVVLTPCGHVVCHQCQTSQRFRQCPMCRVDVAGATQALFL